MVPPATPCPCDAVIRPCRPDDAGAVAAIYRPHVETGTASFETTAPDAAEMAQRMARVVDAGWPWLVLEIGGAVKGYAYASQFRDRAGYRATGETSIYLAADIAGQGLGRQLLAAVVTEAEAAGFETLLAVIGDARNLPSIAVHRALGFREVGRLEGAGRKFGDLIDVVLMQRPRGA
jgi:phosphinothricin acetyltransferase